MAVDKFQKEQLKKLRAYDESSYPDASIYTVLLDLCEGNGVEEVLMILHNVANDLGQRDKIEKLFGEAKNWNWK